MATFDETTAHITRAVRAQAALLDHTGHVWQGLPREEVARLVDEMQEARQGAGWRPLDMTGRWHPRKYRRPS